MIRASRVSRGQGMEMSGTYDCDVMIAGAGPVGLALALELGLRQIPCVMVEKRDGALHVPKMSVVSTRSMEFCRRWGIADEVRSAVWDRSRRLDFVYVENLKGRELARLGIPSYRDRDPDRPTPEPSAHCPQIFFDPILGRRARREKSLAFMYNSTLDGFEQDGEGVTAAVATEGQTQKIRARYLVGCDGATGYVRDALGVKLEGLGAIADSVNLFFRAPQLIDLHDKGWARIYRLIDETGCWSELIPIDGKETWRLTVFDEPQAAVDPDKYLRRMLGDGFTFEMINISAWERKDFVAETFRKGRVFIAGDAAHQCSPTGGIGMATGIEEAVNLAWKLDAALKGWAGPRLLDSYTAERHKIAQRTVDLSTRAYKNIASIPGWRHGGDVDGDATLEEWRGHLDRYTIPDHVKMQYTYENSPICALDGTPAPDPEPKIFAPSSRPGSRAPHVWLADGKAIFDLFDEGFTLLRLGANAPSGEGLLKAARARGLPIHSAHVVEAEALEIYSKPLVLIRPDGHVAWRGDSEPTDPLAIIDLIRGA